MGYNRERLPSINFNGISPDLSENELNQLKALYKFYHCKFWCYNRMHHNYRMKKFLCNTGIMLFSSTGMVASILMHGTALIAISAVGLIIKGYVDINELDNKISTTKGARQLYQGLISEIREALRGGTYSVNDMITYMKLVDQHVANTCCAIPDKISRMYYEIYID